MRLKHLTLYLILLAGIIICLIILILQISKAKNITVKHTELPLIAYQATNIPNDPNDPIIGNRGAPVTITAFIDFNDPQSRQVYKKIREFILKNPTKIRMIFKDYPKKGLFADDNLKPHLAAFCAHKHNQFDEYAKRLSELTSKTKDVNTLTDIAEKSGLPIASWSICLDSTEAKAKVESSISFGRSIYLSSSPVIFINNLQVNYLDKINLNNLLEEVIKEN